jgi:hypothetical protein
MGVSPTNRVSAGLRWRPTAAITEVSIPCCPSVAVRSSIGLLALASTWTSQPAVASSLMKILEKLALRVAIMTREKITRLNMAMAIPVRPSARPG